MDHDKEREIAAMFDYLHRFVNKYGTHRPGDEKARDYLCELYLFINAQNSLVRHTVPRVADIPMCPHAPEYTRRDYESGYVQYDPYTGVLKVDGCRVIY